LQWKCSRGHTWKAACSSRSRNGCPVCGNKEVLIGFNDIFTTHPELAKQAKWLADERKREYDAWVASIERNYTEENSSVYSAD
jgi:hypothetical protein